MMATATEWRWLGVIAVGASAWACAPKSAAPAMGDAPPEGAVRAEAVPPDFNQTKGWLGADGASTLRLGDGRVLWLFGDTFVGTLKPDGGCAEGTKMVNNTIAVQTMPRGAEKGSMSYYWGPTRDGEPTSWALSPAATGEQAKTHWMWPSGGGIRVGAGDGERLVLFFMMMRRKDKSDSIWNFEPHGTATVTVLNPGEPAAQWKTEVAPLRDREPELNAKAPVRAIGWGAAVIPEPRSDDHVLIFGVDGSKVLDKRLVLARSPRESIRRFETWEFRTADGWSKSESEAASIAGAMADEFSVSRVMRDGREVLMLIQMEANLGKRVMARFAEKAEGPWSDGETVFTCPEPAADSRSLVYSGKAHPEISGPDALLVTYCVNSTDFWHVVGHVAMYRPRVVEVAWSSLKANAPAKGGSPKQSEGAGATGR